MQERYTGVSRCSIPPNLDTAVRKMMFSNSIYSGLARIVVGNSQNEKPKNDQQTMAAKRLAGDRLILGAKPVWPAERQGDALTVPESHISFWIDLQQSGTVPFDMEYDEHPRGGVVFDLKTRQFKISTDCCILERKAVLHRVKKEMNLPGRRIIVLPDDNFRCARCLELVLTLS
jgi:hypothetical protein